MTGRTIATISQKKCYPNSKPISFAKALTCIIKSPSLFASSGGYFTQKLIS